MSSHRSRWFSLWVTVLFMLQWSMDARSQDGTAEDARRQHQRAVDLYKQGNYKEGMPIAERALKIREQLLGAEHADTAASLDSVASFYVSTGAYSKAEQLYQRAIATREKVLGADHPDTAASLTGLARLHFAAGAHDRAEQLVSRALAIRERVLGADHPDTASSLNGLAILYMDEANYSKAAPLYHRAISIYEKAFGPEHSETAALLQNLGILHFRTGDYTKAEQLYQRTLRILETRLGVEHPLTITAVENLAVLYSVTAAYAEAERLYRRALASREKALGPQHPLVAHVLSNQGGLYWGMGDFAKAEPLLQRALTIRQKTLRPDHPDTAALLDTLGGMYWATGAYEKARFQLQRALNIHNKVLGPRHPDTAISRANLALVYQEAGAYETANLYFERALAVLEATLGENHRETAIVLSNLANLNALTGAYAKALPRQQRALQIRERVLGGEHPETAESLDDLADLYRISGAHAKAEPLYRRALAIREKALGSEHPNTVRLTNDIATLRWMVGDANGALGWYRRAQQTQARTVERFLLSTSEVRKQAYLQVFLDDTFRHVSFSVAVPGVESSVLGMIGVLQYKARALDAASEGVTRLRRSAKTEDRALFERLADVANQFSVLTYRGPEQLSVVAFRERLQDLSRQQEELEIELSRRSSAFREQVAPITLASIRGGLPGDAALIEWFCYKPFDPKGEGVNAQWLPARYVAYFLKRSDAPVVIDVGEAAEIDRLAQEFRSAASNPRRGDLKQHAAALSQKLIAPLRPHLAGVKRLLVSPDGALNLVPMVALVNERDQYLAEQFEITLLTSGRDLLRPATDTAVRRESVVIASPDYGVSSQPAKALPSRRQRSADLDRGGLTFRALPGTAAEASAIASLLAGRKTIMLTHAEATEANLKQLHGPQILHVATHGFFLQDQPRPGPPRNSSSQPNNIPQFENPLLRSGLALAGANARRSGVRDDGILTALEASQLDLQGTQLVVLSACETGLADVSNGGGVGGLRHALFLAGVEAQISSLWKVADLQTKDLMVSFYGHLVRGEGRSTALQMAQLEMLSTTRRSHPYFWAGFVHIGRWTPLSAVE